MVDVLIETAWRAAWWTRDFIKALVPGPKWLAYAALRLGSFMLSYFMIIAVIVVGGVMAEIAFGFAAFVAIVPVAVIAAIRVSGALTERRRPK